MWSSAHVGDGGHAAVPGVGGIEPAAQAHLDDARRPRPARANHRSAAQVSASNSVGGPWRRADAVGGREHLRRPAAAKSAAAMGEPSTTIRSR